jgi:predicted TIM-barrel fold metal-dependent hydrolase
MPNSIIDSQVHAYERDHPGRPWVGTLAGPDEVTGDDMVAAMDAVGVDGALLVSPWSMYRFDASYALEVHAGHPGRFGLVKPFDPRSHAVAEEMQEWARQPGVVGARIMLGDDSSADDEGVVHILHLAAELGLPVNLLAWGRPLLLLELAERAPETQLVLDHLGLAQPFKPPAPDDPFGALSDVLALAQRENIAIKISGACTLSHRPFPYDDIWPPLHRILEAFGVERCMWGTDWTRAVNLLTYREGVSAFRDTTEISDAERAELMGGSLSRIYGWTPGVSQGAR